VGFAATHGLLEVDSSGIQFFQFANFFRDKQALRFVRVTQKNDGHENKPDPGGPVSAS
jgi:hypothetical protein